MIARYSGQHGDKYIQLPLDLGAINADISDMTQTGYITGQAGFFRTLIRGFIVAAMAIGGLFMLIASATFAFIVIAGLVVLGLIAFAVFWLKAKITGKPFGPKAQFEQARKDMEAQFSTYRETAGEGPVIDAHQTPDGWSVED